MNSFQKALSILQRLESAGHEAYLVGGCVRDRVMGRTPKDYDITTSALPDVTQGLFEKTIPTGIQHGTVTVVIDGESFEVTTFRVDGHYSDGRRPDTVAFTANLEEDLKRRDLTINAMAMNSEEEIIDPFGGRDDIAHKIIRCVGKPEDRFAEDALRELRAIRFAAQLGFTLHGDIVKFLEGTHGLGVSKERIRDELNKILMSDAPVYGINLLLHFGLSQSVLPWQFVCSKFGEFVNNVYHCYDVRTHSIQTLNHIALSDRLELRLACLLHDVGKLATLTYDEYGVAHYPRHAEKSVEIVGDWMRHMKYSNAEIELTCKLIQFHDYYIENTTPAAVKRFLNKFQGTREEAFMWAYLRQNDIMAQNPFFFSDRYRKINDVMGIINNIYSTESCFTLKDLKINGDDLSSIGIPKGPVMGVILHSLLELVIADAIDNEKQALLEKANELFTTR